MPARANVKALAQVPSSSGTDVSWRTLDLRKRSDVQQAWQRQLQACKTITIGRWDFLLRFPEWGGAAGLSLGVDLVYSRFASIAWGHSKRSWRNNLRSKVAIAEGNAADSLTVDEIYQ